MTAALLGLLGAALAGSTGLSDAGEARTGRVALIVPSPGLGPTATDRLARRLERGGWDAWRLDLVSAAADPEQAAAEAIPAALAELRARGPVLLVGEGLGGRVAAMSVARGAARPDALALLGAPLDLQAAGDQPFALHLWLSERPVPAEGLDLEEARHARWRDQRVLPLLLGEPLPPLGTLPASWLSALATEVREGPRISLEGVDLPIWAAASPSDDLAPPESVRAGLGEGTFLRLGYLNLDPREPDHAGLLTNPAPAKALLAWAKTLPL